MKVENNFNNNKYHLLAPHQMVYSLYTYNIMKNLKIWEWKRMKKFKYSGERKYGMLESFSKIHFEAVDLDGNFG